MNAKPQRFKAVINGKSVICNSNLERFEIFKKASSNIDYFAICRADNSLFIQFLNGKCFLYHAVPLETLEAAKEAESIGKFFHASIKGKFEDQELEPMAIKPDDSDEDEDNDMEGELEFVI